MKHTIYILLTIMIVVIIYNQASFADELIQKKLLYTSVPKYKNLIINNNDEYSSPIKINCDLVRGIYPDSLIFTGNVHLQQGNKHLYANQIELNQIKLNKKVIKIINAIGNVQYQDNQVFLKGVKALFNLNTKSIYIWQSEYKMVGKQNHGTAEQIEIRDNNRFIIMKNASFSSCLSNSKGWSIIGSKIIQDNREKETRIWNATLNIGKIPIFYSPYWKLSIDNGRHSGFLVPNIKHSSNNGLEITFPYYWNIDPQTDLTIIPHYMSKKGLQLQNEFRYLTNFGLGLIKFYYLVSSKKTQEKVENKITQKNDFSKWLLHWQHSGVYNEHWRFNSNYTKMNYSDYFNDFNFKSYDLINDYIIQNFNLEYADTSWAYTLSVRSPEIFKGINYNIYRAIPQLDLNFYPKNIGPLKIHLYAQAVRFVSANKLMPETIRLHVEPTVKVIFSKGKNQIDAEAKFLATHYEQDISHYYNNSTPSFSNKDQLNHFVNRTLPEFKINAKLLFNRNTKHYLQTLEPHVQYFYIPYRNQNNIYLYDSYEIKNNYINLFQENISGGLDRIPSVNAISTDVITRIYDNKFIERFSASLTQIYQFNLLNVNKTNKIKKNNTYENKKIIWLGKSYWKVNNHLNIHTGIQYNLFLNKISQINTIMEYHYNNDHMLQFNYRYLSSDYVHQILNKPNLTNNLIHRKGISQVGVKIKWPITDTLSLASSYYYDAYNNKINEQSIELKYRSCCYAINLAYQRKINNLDKNNRYFHQISFNIEMRGINSTDKNNSDKNKILNNNNLLTEKNYLVF